MIKDAEISECGRYRYSLRRQWRPGAAAVMFIMLNPSTADAWVDDPTIRKCIRFADAWGYGELLVGNLFAWRSPRPQDLRLAADPVGPGNDDALLRMAEGAGRIVAAWGNYGGLLGRDRAVRGMFPGRLYALLVTGGGQPGHPLYISHTARPFLLE